MPKVVITASDTPLSDNFVEYSMKYRSRLDIAAAMLEIAQGGAIKTRIMYRAFVSYPQLNEYLEMLQENGMLEHDKGQNEYYTTERGKHLLKIYKELGKMVPKDSMLTKMMVR